MNVKELAEKLNMKIIQPAGADENEIESGYTSDLLSDVMGNAEAGCALITIQAHVNTVAVASLVGAAAIIVCSNYPVTNDMVEAAARENVPILQTDKNQFTASHLVYAQICEN